MRLSYFLPILSSILLLTASGYTQNAPDHHYFNLPRSVQSQQALEALLERELRVDLSLLPFRQKESPGAKHYSFELAINDVPVYGALVKWNVYGGGASSCSYPKLQATVLDDQFVPSTETLQRYMSFRTDGQIVPRIHWVLEDGVLHQRWVMRAYDGSDVVDVILDERGEVSSRLDRVVYDHRDTTAIVPIYLPDPLTSAMVAYGDPYADNDDQANAALIDEMFLDTIRFRFDSTAMAWKLESNIAKAIDHTSPDIAPPYLIDVSNISVDRSDPDFEYFNTYYHLHQTQYIIRSLGFDDLGSETVHFDAHGSTADQSSFSAMPWGPYLSFGTGGVDDAEDADVIVHEYGHAISYSAAPETNFGSERAALDEGFCDYLAASYSRRISDFNASALFSWDTGEGIFWKQRTLINDRTYPTDLRFDIYEDGLMWASALAEISDYKGLDLVDRAMLCSLFEWYANMQLSDAASLFLKADSSCNDGALGEIARIVFCNRGLLKGCEDTLISTLPLQKPYLGNSFDFAFNRGPLYIYQNSYTITRIEIMDVQGRLVEMQEFAPDPERLFYEFADVYLPQGVFILRLITTEGEEFSEKLISTWR